MFICIKCKNPGDLGTVVRIRKADKHLKLVCEDCRDKMIIKRMKDGKNLLLERVK